LETFKQRFKRYVDNESLEIFGWLTVFLHNSYWGEIYAAKENRQYHSVYLLTHALIQMISENMFGFRGKQATKFYLENFVDGDTPETKFSSITDDIHDARNVMAHQGYSSLQHRVEYFADDMTEGWKFDNGSILINPKVYGASFEAAFRGKIVQTYEQLTNETRIIRKYNFIRQWLQLDSKNPISLEIKKLAQCVNPQDVHAQESVVRAMLYSTYNL
jgi:hypothetical protein